MNERTTLGLVNHVLIQARPTNGVQSGRRGINFLVQTADGSGLPYILFFKDKYFDQVFSKKLRFLSFLWESVSLAFFDFGFLCADRGSRKRKPWTGIFFDRPNSGGGGNLGAQKKRTAERAKKVNFVRFFRNEVTPVSLSPPRAVRLQLKAS